MANSQSFLLQLPNIFHLMGGAWSRKVLAAEDSALLDSLAKLIYAEQHQALAQGWEQLRKPGSREAGVVEARILELIHGGRTGRPGIIGEAIFPDRDQVFRDLAVMLRIHSRAEAVRESWPTAAQAKENSIRRPLQICANCWSGRR